MIFKIILIGVGATIIMDLWAYIQSLFQIKSLDYRFVGRWILYIKSSKIMHDNIFVIKPKKYELALGWIVHYLIGILFSFVLVIIFGKNWINNPTILPPLIIGLITTIAPFFILQPAFGIGIAASKLPNKNTLRLRSLITHLIYGLGLYLTAIILI